MFPDSTAFDVLIAGRTSGVGSFFAVQSALSGGGSFFLMLLQTLLALALVCGLAYFIFRWVLPRLDAARSANSMVRVVDVAALDARKRLYVIEVAGRWMLIGASEAGLQFLSELDAATAEEAASELQRTRLTLKKLGATARGAFADRFARMLNRRR